MRRASLVLLMAAILITTAMPAAPRAAAAQTMTYGVNRRASAAPWGEGCTADARVWVQEIGKSGVTRFRGRWELRGKYDSGLFPIHGKTGWYVSRSFPNNAASKFVYFSVGNGMLNFFSNKEYSLWAKLVGERPSFWQRDVVLRPNLGTIICSNDGIGVPLG